MAKINDFNTSKKSLLFKDVWQSFIEELKSILPITPEDIDRIVISDQSIEIGNLLNNFSKVLENEVEKLKTSYTEEKTLPIKFTNEIIEHFSDLIGCSEQCPFCKAPCRITSKYHVINKPKMKHCTIEHYPKGLGGYHVIKSEELSTDNCTTSVNSSAKFQNELTKFKEKKYSQYFELYPDWDILKEIFGTSKYWKRVMGKFSLEFAKIYNAKEGNVPPEWKNFTKEECVKSIKDFLT